MRPNRPVYLDNQATTPCDPRVVAAMLPFFTERFGNPHSVEHAIGRDAEAAVEAARAEVAALLGAEPREVVFTSGATEANNLAIKGAARHAAAMGSPRRRVVTVATEHKCVLESVADLAAEGFEPVFLPVRPDGLLDPAALEAALAVPTLLVSVMAVNNETGVIQDLADARGPRPRGRRAVPYRCRAGGRQDPARRGGAGSRSGLAQRPQALRAEGRGRALCPPPPARAAGTPALRRRAGARLALGHAAGAAGRGLREACRIARAEMADEAARIGALRERLASALLRDIPGLRVNGAREARIAGNLNLTFPRRTATALMAACPELCVSTGSACSSAEIEPSYVLRAMGLDAAAAGRSLRLGIGRFTSPADVDFAATALAAAHNAELIEA